MKNKNNMDKIMLEWKKFIKEESGPTTASARQANALKAAQKQPVEEPSEDNPPPVKPAQEELNIAVEQIGSLLSGYVSEEDIKKVYDFIKYFKQKNSLDALNALYQKEKGETLADGVNDVSGLQNYKKAILEMLGAKFESTVLDAIAKFFGAEENKEEIKPLADPKAYLHWDGDELHYKINGTSFRSWPGTSGKVWFWPAGWRDQSKKSFGPIPEGTYQTGDIQTVYRDIDPGLWDELKYFFTNPAHNFGTKEGETEVFSQIAWGNHRIPIYGEKLGRSGFYIHGGTLRGSSGCIDLGDGMESFAKFWVANSIARKGGIGPSLIVDYKGRVQKQDTEEEAQARMKGVNVGPAAKLAAPTSSPTSPTKPTTGKPAAAPTNPRTTK